MIRQLVLFFPSILSLYHLWNIMNFIIISIVVLLSSRKALLSWLFGKWSYFGRNSEYISFSETVSHSFLKYSPIVSCRWLMFSSSSVISLLTSNVGLKNSFARSQLSVVNGSFNSGVGSLVCGVNVASSKFSSWK